MVEPESDITHRSTEGPVIGIRLCVVGQALKQDDTLREALKEFDATVVYSDCGHEFIGTEDCKHTGFIIDDFSSPVFQEIQKTGARIYGPPAVLHYSRLRQPLPCTSRSPLYCTSMQNMVVCFTGFRKKEDLASLINHVHYMGGRIRKDFNLKVTHLVANDTSGEKYRYAVSLGRPVMRNEWIYVAWDKRHDLNFKATDPSLMEYKVQPFFSCVIAFFGFSEEEQKHVEDITLQNGGAFCNLEATNCTHIVVDDHHHDFNLPSNRLCGADIVKTEWFWASIQMDARADEKNYRLKQDNDGGQSKYSHAFYTTPESKGCKRRRLKETLGQLADYVDLESPRTSTDIAGLSISGSFLDSTHSPEHTDILCEMPTPKHAAPSFATGAKAPLDIRNMTPRQQVCMELLQTETNYVAILHTIIKLIKEPIENADQVGGPLLDPTEVKIVFGNLAPIYEVHCKLKEDLTFLVNNWKEENGIGKVILTHSHDILKAYPPFVNFFENTKEMLLHCDASKPRFHAFLKICQSKPECGRQSLVELMIRPVQRLPSVVLLLNDIMKHTSKNNPDHCALEEALTALKEVMTHINEDKRKTEGQVAMFDIVNDIENCPANLLSSHRAFITKADMVELSDEISGRGDNLTMFLFTDVLEICKRRKCGVGSIRSPSVVSLQAAKNPQKCYKHIDLISLPHVKRVVDITETEECKNVFALVCRSHQELKERLYTFTLMGDEIMKANFLKQLCRQMANAICSAHAESFLTSLEPQHLDIMSSDVTRNTLTKAMKFATKTSRKVTRAFSFSKTPRKLRRAVSTMMSPLVPSITTSGTLQASRGFPSASAMDLTSIDSPLRGLPLTPNLKMKSVTIGPSTASRM